VLHSIARQGTTRFHCSGKEPIGLTIEFRRRHSRAGLPDGLFSNQKSEFGKICEGLAMEDDGIFYGHIVHFVIFY
jgi:hypothetical protein